MRAAALRLRSLCPTMGSDLLRAVIVLVQSAVVVRRAPQRRTYITQNGVVCKVQLAEIQALHVRGIAHLLVDLAEVKDEPLGKDETNTGIVM